MRRINTPKITLLFSLGALLLVALLASLYLYLVQNRKVNRARKLVTHTLEVINTSEKILRIATSEVMAHRGYMISGNRIYLNSLADTRKDIQVFYDSLQFLLKDNPNQQKRLLDLKGLLDRRKYLTDSINKLETQDPELAKSVFDSGMGRNLMDSIQQNIKEFQLIEYNLLQQRQHFDENASNHLNLIRMMLIMILVALTAAFVIVLVNYLKTQQKLVEESKYISALLDRVSDAVILLNGSFVVTGWNAGAEEIYDIQAADAIGKSIRELIALTKSDFPESGIQHLLTTGQWNGELRALSITGKEHYLSAAISLIRNKKNHPVGSVALLRDITPLKKREKVLSESNKDLEQLLKEQLNETRQANIQLKEMNNRLERTREEERKRISRELHDDLGQVLTSAKIHLSFIVEELNVQEPEMSSMLQNLLDTLDRSIQSVRSLSMELRPGLLQDLGLFTAMKFHAERFTSQTHIPVEFVNEVPELQVDTEFAVHVFRIFQEALNNIAKHANATQVKTFITLDDEKLVVSISDNGKGFKMLETGRKSLGLTSMQERSAIINGECRIESNPGAGTTISITVPLM